MPTLVQATNSTPAPRPTESQGTRTGDPEATKQAGVLQARYAALAAEPNALAKALTGRSLAQLPAQQQAKLLAFGKALKAGEMVWPQWRVAPHSKASPAAGGGDALFQGAVAAFVPGKGGDGGTALLSRGLSAKEREAAIAEELGEAVAAAAGRAGVEVAVGDRGARLAAALGGRREFTAEEFAARPDDSTMVRLDGQLVPAAAKQQMAREALNVQFPGSPGFSLSMPVNGRTFKLKDGSKYDLDKSRGEISMKVNLGYTGAMDVLASNGKKVGSIRVSNYGNVPNPVIGLDPSQTHTLGWGPQGIVVKKRAKTGGAKKPASTKSFVDITALADSSGQITWRTEQRNGTVSDGRTVMDGGTGDLDKQRNGKIQISPGRNKAFFVQVDKGQRGKWGDGDEFYRFETNAKGNFKQVKQVTPLAVTEAQGLWQGGTIELYDAKGALQWKGTDNQGRDWDTRTDNTKFTAMVRSGFRGFVKVNGKRFEVNNGRVSAQATTPPPPVAAPTYVTLNGNDNEGQNIDSIFQSTRFEYRYTDPRSKREVTKTLKATFAGKPGEGGSALVALPTGTSGTLTVVSLGSKAAAESKTYSQTDVSEISGSWSYSVRDVGKPSFAIGDRPAEKAGWGDYYFRLEPPLTDIQSQYLTDFKLRKSEFLAAGKDMLKALDLPESSTVSVEQASDNAGAGIERFNKASAQLKTAQAALAQSATDLTKSSVPQNWFLNESKGLEDDTRALAAEIPVKLSAYANDYNAKVNNAKSAAKRAKTEAMLNLLGSVLGGFSGIGSMAIATRQLFNDGSIYKGRQYWFAADVRKSENKATDALVELRGSNLNERQERSLGDYEALRNQPLTRFPGKNDTERTAEQQRQMKAVADDSDWPALKALYGLDVKASITRNKQNENNLKLENVKTSWGSLVFSVAPVALDGASLDAYIKRMNRLNAAGTGDMAKLQQDWETAKSSVARLFETLRGVVPWDNIRKPQGQLEEEKKNNDPGPAVDGYAVTRWRVERKAWAGPKGGGSVTNKWLEGSKF